MLLLANGSSSQAQTATLGSCEAADVGATGAVLFDEKHCLGNRLDLANPGKYELGNFQFDDITSSIFLEEGWSILMHKDAGQAGNFACWSESPANLGLDHYGDGSVIDNSISSIQIFDVPNCKTGTLVITPNFKYYIPALFKN